MIRDELLDNAIRKLRAFNGMILRESDIVRILRWKLNLSYADAIILFNALVKCGMLVKCKTVSASNPSTLLESMYRERYWKVKV